MTEPTSSFLGIHGTALALRDGFAPPTRNLTHPDPQCDLDYVPNKARKVEVEHVLSNSFGFGGTNATLVFSKHNGTR